MAFAYYFCFSFFFSIKLTNGLCLHCYDALDLLLFFLNKNEMHSLIGANDEIDNRNSNQFTIGLGGHREVYGGNLTFPIIIYKHPIKQLSHLFSIYFPHYYNKPTPDSTS